MRRGRSSVSCSAGRSPTGESPGTRTWTRGWRARCRAASAHSRAGIRWSLSSSEARTWRLPWRLPRPKGGRSSSLQRQCRGLRSGCWPIPMGKWSVWPTRTPDARRRTPGERATTRPSPWHREGLHMAGLIDRDLLARAVAGDDRAFAALVEPHRRAVFRHCYRMLGSGADAEDATQDTLERAWRRLATYDGSGPFGAWLQRIATNICLDGLRARRSRIGPVGYGSPAAPGMVPGPPDPELAWVEPVSDAALRGTADPQDEVVRREEISLAFAAALQRLAPRQRAALLLHDVLAFTHAEVGEVLSAGTTAVNSLLSRARESVRASAGRPQPDINDPPGTAAAGTLRAGVAPRRHRRIRATGRRGHPVLHAPAHHVVQGPGRGRHVRRERDLRACPPARDTSRGGYLQRPARVRDLRARRRRSAHGHRPAGSPARRPGQPACDRGSGVLPRPRPRHPLRLAGRAAGRASGVAAA